MQDDVAIIKEITKLAIDANLIKVICVASRSNIVMYSSEKYSLNQHKIALR